MAEKKNSPIRSRLFYASSSTRLFELLAPWVSTSEMDDESKEVKLKSVVKGSCVHVAELFDRHLAKQKIPYGVDRKTLDDDLEREVAEGVFRFSFRTLYTFICYIIVNPKARLKNIPLIDDPDDHKHTLDTLHDFLLSVKVGRIEGEPLIPTNADENLKKKFNASVDALFRNKEFDQGSQHPLNPLFVEQQLKISTDWNWEYSPHTEAIAIDGSTRPSRLLNYQLKLKEDFKTIELGKFFSMPIDQVIPQQLSCRSQDFIDRNRDLLSDSIKASVLIDRRWDAMIASPAGMGKSTLLRSLLFQRALDIVPFFVDLSTVGHNLKKKLKQDIKQSGLTPEELKNNHVVLFIDAVDEYEIKSKNRFSPLFDFKAKYNCTLIFSGRFQSPDLSQKGIPVFSLNAFEFEDVRTVFRNQFNELAENYLSIPGIEKAELIRKPLFLTLYMNRIVLEEQKNAVIDLDAMGRLLKNSAALFKQVVVDSFLLEQEQKHHASEPSIERWRGKKLRQIECIGFLAVQLSLLYPNQEMLKEHLFSKLISRPIEEFDLEADFEDVDFAELSNELELHGILRYEEGKLGFANKEMRVFFSAFYLSEKTLSVVDTVRKMLNTPIPNTFYTYFFGLINAENVLSGLNDDSVIGFKSNMENALFSFAAYQSGNLTSNFSIAEFEEALADLNKCTDRPFVGLPEDESIELTLFMVDFLSRLEIAVLTDFIFEYSLAHLGAYLDHPDVRKYCIRVMRIAFDPADDSLMFSEELGLYFAIYYWFSEAESRYKKWLELGDLDKDLKVFSQSLVINHTDMFYTRVSELIAEKKLEYNERFVKGIIYATYSLAIAFEQNIKESFEELKMEHQYLILACYLENLEKNWEQEVDHKYFPTTPSRAMTYSSGIFIRGQVQGFLIKNLLENVNRYVFDESIPMGKKYRHAAFIAALSAEQNFFEPLEESLRLREENSNYVIQERVIETLMANIHDIADRPNAMTSDESRARLQQYLEDPDFPKRTKEHIIKYARMLRFNIYE